MLAQTRKAQTPTQSSWVKPQSDFKPTGRRPEDSRSTYPEVQEFIEKTTGVRWIGRCNNTALLDPDSLAYVKRSAEFVSIYIDEVLEQLGFCIYNLFGAEVPHTVLSSQPVTRDNEENYGCDGPRLHCLVEHTRDLQQFGASFFDEKLSPDARELAANLPKIRCFELEHGGRTIPIRGLGTLLAISHLLMDRNVIGNNCSSLGYVIREDEKGFPYAQIVKIDSGYCFAYSQTRFEKPRDVRTRLIQITSHKAKDQELIRLEDLPLDDQKEFLQVAIRVLRCSNEDLKALFAETGKIADGIPATAWESLFNGLLTRKNQFIAAYAPEIMQEINCEIAAIYDSEDSSNQTSKGDEKFRGNDKNIESIRNLTELRVRLLSIVSEYGSAAETTKCLTCQILPRNPNFLGREEVINRLLELFEESEAKVVNLHGSVGAGKSQLALAYARAAAFGEPLGGQKSQGIRPYEFVIWIDMASDVDVQFRGIAQWLLRGDIDENPPMLAVYEFLKSRRCLLILDGVRDEEACVTYLPPQEDDSEIRTLITTLSPIPDNALDCDYHNISVGEFTRDEAQRFISSYVGNVDEEAVDRIVSAVGALPLALTQVVECVLSGKCAIDDFCDYFTLQSQDFIRTPLLLDRFHPRALGNSLRASIQGLALDRSRDHALLAEELLTTASYFSKTLPSIEALAQIMGLSLSELQSGIRALEAEGFCISISEGASLYLNPLVRAVVREQLQHIDLNQKSFQKIRDFYVSLMVEIESQFDELVASDKQESGKLAIRDVLENADEIESVVEDFLQVLRSVDAVNGLSPLQQLGLIDLLKGKARLEILQLNKEKFLELIGYVQTLEQKVFGEDSLELATTFVETSIYLGAALIRTSPLGVNLPVADLEDEFKLVESYLQKAIQVQISRLGGRRQEVAETLWRLADVCLIYRQYEKAAHYCNEWKSRFSTILGSEHQLTKKIERLTVSCRMWDEHQFVSSIQSWQEALTNESQNSRGQYTPDQIYKFLDVALHALTKNNWKDLEKNPDRHGIPRNLFEAINRVQRENPAMLPAETHRDIVNLLHTFFAKGGGIFMVDIGGYPHLLVPFQLYGFTFEPGIEIIPPQVGMPAQTIRLGSITSQKT